MSPRPESAATQRHRILERLRSGPLSTIDAIEQLGVLRLSGRILELRQTGFEITRRLANIRDKRGILHCVAQYQLIAEPKQLDLF